MRMFGGTRVWGTEKYNNFADNYLHLVSDSKDKGQVPLRVTGLLQQYMNFIFNIYFICVLLTLHWLVFPT